MIVVTYTKITRRLGQQKFSEYLMQLPESQRNKVQQFKRWEDAHASLLGKLLLIECLATFNIADLDLHQLQLSTYNKPYFNANLDFNISHSGCYVVCVMSDHCRIGIDIEEIHLLPVQDFKNQFGEHEWNRICMADNRIKEFYKYWTGKEAVIKADGRGLSLPLKEVLLEADVAYTDNGKWLVEEVFLCEDVVCHLASDQKNKTGIVKKEVFFV